MSGSRFSRALLAVPVLAGVVASGVAPASFSDCVVSDERLTELSGLVVDGPRWWAIADGGRTSRAVALDPATCATSGTRSARIDPADVEDLGIGPDGALWLADIGDNTASRDSVAVVVLPTAGPPRLHRLVYPDGPHDAEALVVGDDGVPVLVTKSTGTAGIYRPAGPLGDGPGPTPLVRAGQIVLPASDGTTGPIGSLGSRTVTGAALSPPGAVPGRVVGVRTYTDAWLFRLPPGRAVDAGTLVEALGTAPYRVALPDQPQGEALAFTADGTLLSGSEARDGRPAGIRTVVGAVADALAPGAALETQPEVPPRTSSTPGWLPAAVSVGAAAVLLGAAAAAMTWHTRRRRRR